MTTSTNCAFCRKPIKTDAESCTVTVLAAGVPEPAVAHVKCRDRNQRAYDRFMKASAKQAKQASR